MADVHVYVDRPAGKEDTALEDLEEVLTKLDHVYDVDVNSPGNVVAVSFEGAGRRGKRSSAPSRKPATGFRGSRSGRILRYEATHEV